MSWDNLRFVVSLVIQILTFHNGIQKIFVRVFLQTINDTRLAIQQIAKYLNESITPDQSNRTGKKQKKPTNSDSLKAESKNENGNSTSTTTPAPTSTTEGSLISRSNLVKLIARNVKGLIRLFNIEWSDAWKVSILIE